MNPFVSLRRSPLFAAVAVLSLGLALALNTTMFALVDAVVNPQVPYREPERLFTAGMWGGDPRRPVSGDERFRAVRDGSRSYEAIAGYRAFLALAQRGKYAENRFIVITSPHFFNVLGVRPALGRSLGAVDSAGGGGLAAVISYRLYKRIFDGKGLPTDATITLGTRTFSVVGVMPRGMHYPLDADIWVGPGSSPGDARVALGGGTPLIRLKPGVTLAVAQAEIGVIAARLSMESQAGDRPIAARVQPIIPDPMHLRPLHHAIIGAVVLVFFIACANLGTMMLARGIARRREIAIRMALGASTRSVIRMVLAECGVIATLGGVMGLLLTSWAIWIMSNTTPAYVSELGDLLPVPSWRVFVFALGASGLTILLAGVLPAVRAAAIDPAEPLKDGAGSTSRVGDRYSPLVVTEVALCTTLLMGAALMSMTVFRLDNFRFGFDAKRLVTAFFFMHDRQAPTADDVRRTFDALLVGAGSLPRAEMAATFRGQRVDGPIVFSEEGPHGNGRMNKDTYLVVSPNLLRTLGVPIAEGRDFEEGDRSARDGVAIVDEEVARRLWPDLRSPVGRMLKLGSLTSPQPWIRVVGVSRSVGIMPGNDRDPTPQAAIYVVSGSDSSRYRTIVVRGESADDRVALSLALRRAVQEVAPRLGFVRVEPWLSQHDQRIGLASFLAALFSAFSVFGLALSAVGLYGTLAYSVGRRLREFAVRAALGASRWDVVRLVLHDAAVMALAGVGIGAFVALGATQILSDSLYEVHHADVFALVVAESVLFLVAIVACLSPVQQAAGANPVDALRAN